MLSRWGISYYKDSERVLDRAPSIASIRGSYRGMRVRVTMTMDRRIVVAVTR